METNKHSNWPTPEEAAAVLAQGDRDEAALIAWRQELATLAPRVAA